MQLLIFKKSPIVYGEFSYGILLLSLLNVNKLFCVRVNVNVDAEIPHDEGNPETPDYQFVKWMTVNKVLLHLFIV